MSQKSFTKKSPRPLVVTALIVFVVVLLALSVWFFLLRDKDPTKSYHPKYSVSSSVSQSKSSGGDTGASNEKDSTADSAVTGVTSEQVPAANSGTITIVDLGQADGYVNAKATVSNFNTTQCVYSFTADAANPVVKTTSGSCDGISIPEVEFQYIGTYTLTVTAYNGTTEKLVAMKSLDVR